jgi:cytochrome c oxidase cbb3-type subunit IV
MDIDINVLRGLSTVMVMIGFIGICVWAYSSKRKEEFTQAALMPFADDDLPVTKNTEKNVANGLEQSEHE